MNRLATRFLLWCFGIICFQICLAQTETSLNLHAFRVEGALILDSFVHPGFMVGIERDLTYSTRQSYNERKENHKRRKKSALKEFYWGSSIGGYNHPNNEFLLFWTGDLGFQVSSSKGSIWSAEIGAGIYRSFAKVPVIEAAPSSVSEVGLAGWTGFMPRMFLSWGWSQWMRANKSWTAKVGPMIYLRTGYNHGTVASGAVVAQLIIHDLF